METNEIMVNEDVIDLTEEFTTNENFGKSFKIGVGIGLAIIGGGITYKYVLKPVIARIKARKEEQDVKNDTDDYNVIDVDFRNSDEETD